MYLLFHPLCTDNVSIPRFLLYALVSKVNIRVGYNSSLNSITNASCAKTETN